MVKADDMDIFPTARIANEAGDIALACLLGEAVPTVGRERVGPRGVVEVTLKKRNVSFGSGLVSNGDVVSALNGTIVLVVQSAPENVTLEA